MTEHARDAEAIFLAALDKNDPARAGRVRRSDLRGRSRALCDAYVSC